MEYKIQYNDTDECGNKITFSEGGLWEYDDWDIILNVKFSTTYNNPCHHCTTIDAEHSICPRVIYASNEGGWNSTAICLDCVLEANELLKTLDL